MTQNRRKVMRNTNITQNDDDIKTQSIKRYVQTK